MHEVFQSKNCSSKQKLKAPVERNRPRVVKYFDAEVRAVLIWLEARFGGFIWSGNRPYPVCPESAGAAKKKKARRAGLVVMKVQNVTQA